MENEKDLKLKLRIMRFLWYNGFFTRKNIDIYKYEYGKKTQHQYTDIDAFGIRFHENFTNYMINCDCKSGKNVKIKDRIFWVSGLMNYIHSDKSILVVKDLDESKYYSLSKSLNILPLSEHRLSELEDNYKIKKMPNCGPFDYNNVLLEEKIFNNLKAKLKDAFIYLKIKYWSQKPHKQITALLSCLRDIDNLNFQNKNYKLFLILYIFSLFTVSILKFSEPLLTFSNKKREQYIKEKIAGGSVDSSMIGELYSSFYNFMKAEIKHRYNAEYPVSKNDFVNMMYPNYIKYLSDLIYRISISPSDAVTLPNFMDVISYEFVLKNKKNDLEKKIFSFNHQSDVKKVCKLAKDIFLFAKRSNLLSEETYNEIIDLIK